MATPKSKFEGQFADSLEQSALRVVHARTALDQTIGISPVEQPVTTLRPVEPFEDFRAMLHELIEGGDYNHKTTDELLEIRANIQAIREALSGRYAELARLEALLQQEMTWTNGYLIDLNKAIRQRQDTEPQTN